MSDINERFRGGMKVQVTLSTWEGDAVGEPHDVVDNDPRYFYPSGEEIFDPEEQMAFDRHLEAVYQKESNDGQ